MRVIRILLILLLTIPTNALAAPALSGSYTFGHGDSVSITGTDFETKSEVKPDIWDDGEGATEDSPAAVTGTGSSALRYDEGNGWTDALPSANQDWTVGDEYAMQYRDSWASVAQPHSNSSTYIAGGHQWNCGGGGCNNVQLDIDTGQDNDQLTIIFYAYMPDTWFDYPDGSLTHSNFKFVWYSGGAYFDAVDPDKYWGKTTNWVYDDGISSATFGITTSSMFCPSGNSLWDEVEVINPIGQWVKFIVKHYKGSGSNDDYSEIRTVNGTTQILETNSGCDYGEMASGEDFRRTISLGTYARYRDDSDGAGDCPNAPTNDGQCVFDGMKRFWDDTYIDGSVATVYLADTNDIDTATVIEPQYLTAWSDTGITFTANLGALSLGTAYLFVTNESMEMNATGYSVTLGGAQASGGVSSGAGSGLSAGTGTANVVGD